MGKVGTKSFADDKSRRRVLLTGATGFVGQAAQPALVEAGWSVRCLTRNLQTARERWPDLDWVQGDIGDHAACLRALEQCEAAIYLVHGMGEGAEFYDRELEAARKFARAAASAGVGRVIYLGGVLPRDQSAMSAHLRSRMAVGETLRAGSVPTIELRASMIIGYGSLSWLIVRDLAARLPLMVLPRWLRSRTQPVAIEDVIRALVRALELPLKGSAWFDLPGPEVLSGKEILGATARALDLGRPRMLDVPLLTPHLSSLWVRFVTRADWAVAREVVVGLSSDLLANDDRFWHAIGHAQRLSFAEAARRAIAAEPQAPPRGVWGLIERVRT
jgi:uncharacterized protein YbjT (DUF2867 family)